MLRPILIAELAKEHNGDITTAKFMIDEVSKVGFNIVKLQAYDKDDINTKHINYNRYVKCYLSMDQINELKDYSNEKNLGFWCSVFSKNLIKPLSEITNVVKIPSTYFSCIPFVSDCINHFDECHISTGFSDVRDIKTLSEYYNNICPGYKKLYFYHCTSLYPTPDDLLRLERIKQFNFMGFSYHGKNIDAIINAYLLGAKYIEIHYTIGDRSSWKWDLSEARELIYSLNRTQEMLSDNCLTDKEKDDYNFYKEEYNCLK